MSSHLVQFIAIVVLGVIGTTFSASSLAASNGVLLLPSGYAREVESLPLSTVQQAKFDRRKALLETSFEREKLYDVSRERCGAIVLTDDYAFLHIFKNGGTTVELQTSRPPFPISDPAIQTRRWLAMIRDPIDHFLSGWSECGNRQYQAVQEGKQTQSFLLNNTGSYDERVMDWLQRCKRFVSKSKGNRKKMATLVPLNCKTHSFPQGNFLLDNGTIASQIEMVGDLRELPAVLEKMGWKFNVDTATGRNASSNAFLLENFPRRIDLISNKTLRDLCDFLAIDYFLFDFDPPEVCQDLRGFNWWGTRP